MTEIYFTPQAHKNFFDLHPPSSLDVWRAVGREAYLDNPEQLAIRLYGHTKERYFNTDKLSREGFESLYPNAMFEWNPHMTVEEVEVLHLRKNQEAANQFIISKGQGGLTEALGSFGTAILTSFASPTNIAASFIPIGGQARWGQIIAKAGALAGGMLKGAAANAVFQAGITPVIAANRYFEQSPYGVKEAGFDIAAAAALGAGIHALGYGASKLKNRFFASPEQLHTTWDHQNSVMKQGFKDSIHQVARETHFKPENVEWENLDPTLRQFSTPETPLKDLYQLKGHLFDQAANHPELRPLLQKELEVYQLEEALHTEYKTGGEEAHIPDNLRGQLQAARDELLSAREELKGNPEWESYQQSTQELDKLIRNRIREQQYQDKAYDLSIDDLYIAKSQISAGKHVNLEEPHKAESFYEKDAVLTEEAWEVPDLVEQEGRATDLSVSKALTESVELVKQGMDDATYLTLRESLEHTNFAGKEEFVTGLEELHQLKNSPETRVPELVSREAVEQKAESVVREMAEAIGLEQREQSISAVRLEDAYDFVTRHKSPYLGLKNLLRQVELRQKTASGELRNGFFYDLEQQELVSVFKNKDHHADIARELEALTKPSLQPQTGLAQARLGGLTNNPQAQALAKIIHKWQTIAINRANKAGAYLTPIEGYITRQTHSDSAIRKMGLQEWTRFIMPLLDHEKTFVESKVNLKNVFEALATGKHFTCLEEYTHVHRSSSSDIASKLSAPRKLHFKSADDWLKYNEACGLYRLSDLVLINLERIGESIGLLETLGSNPAVTYRNLQKKLVEDLRARASMDEGALLEMKKVEKESLNGMLDWMMGHNTPENPKAAMYCQAARNVKSMASLGKVVISSFPDMANWAVELQNNGIPLLKSYGNILKALTYSLSSDKKKSLARKLGIACDNLLGFGYSRLNADSHIPGAMTKITNAFFKANCMEWWDRSFKHTMGMLLSNHLAESSLKDFHALPKVLRDKLTHYGISSEEWGILRHATEMVEGNAYLIPDKILSIKDTHFERAGIPGDLIEPAKENLAQAVRGYILDRVDTGIATPGQIERYLIFAGTTPGTPFGEAVRFLMQFKTFPLTFIMRPLKSVTVDQVPIAERTGNWKDIVRSLQNPTTINLMGQLLMGSTILGYLSMSTNKINKGEDVPDPTDGKVWQAAVLKGGGLGIFGDFLFQEYSRYRHTAITEMAGPMAGVVTDVAALFTDAKNGDWDKGKKASLKLLKRNFPGQNLFYLEPALAPVWEGLGLGYLK